MPEAKAVIFQTPFLFRNLVPYSLPTTLDGNFWRRAIRKQPFFSDIVTNITMYIQSLPYDIRARDPQVADKLKDDVEYHKDIFKNAQSTTGRGFLNYLEQLLEDLNIPFGGASETVRYDDGRLYQLRVVDGATFYPINDPTGKMVAAQITESANPIVFDNQELIRIGRFPRPDIKEAGWFMPPAEKVYLALEMLVRGDRYYAQLLLDTPEAGILDLGDMSKESAENWLESFRTMFSGLDPLKVPVLYEHTGKAQYIPFNRSPNDLLYDKTTFRYMQLACAAWGITTSDLGIRMEGGGSLSSDIRDERKSRTTGYASVKMHLEEHFNKILPPELMFSFIDVNDEVLVSKGRARTANAVAGKNLIDAKILTPKEVRKQLVADGLVTIPLTDEPDENDFPDVKDPNISMLGGKFRDKVQGKTPMPATEGGHGEVKKSIASDDKETLRTAFILSFNKIFNSANKSRIRKLIRRTLEKNYVMVQKAYHEQAYFEDWQTELIGYLLNKNDVFVDDFITKTVNDSLDSLNSYFDRDKWWEVTPDNINETKVTAVLMSLYKDGAYDTARRIQTDLYERDLSDSPEIELRFENLASDDDFGAKLALLLEMVNRGTIFYSKRLALATVTEIEKFPVYLEKIRSGSNLQEVISDNSLMEYLTDSFISDFQEIMMDRLDAIVKMETRRFYNAGVIKQLKSVGVTEKRTLLGANPCDVCLENSQLGFVEIDYKYKSKMGDEVEHSPFHPECECGIDYKMPNEKPNYFG